MGEEDMRGPLPALLAEALDGDDAWQELALLLIGHLAANEVLEVPALMAGIVATARAAAGSARAAAGWLTLLQRLIGGKAAMPDAADLLIRANALAEMMALMEQQVTSAVVQMNGMEAASNLIGNRWYALEIYADVRGVERVEEALRRHVDEVMVQSKGVRALGSGIRWPPAMRKRANYSMPRAISLTKAAMDAHPNNLELACNVIERLSKYVVVPGMVDEVRADEGEALVKSVMRIHLAEENVQQFGRVILDALGTARTWQPTNPE
eukprot:NODE_14660_length_1095_cov_3.392562.p1 GENE.NODE_14660_length_1095_cov_3.392562~~NODE_14660_length_1095_cov_3.392562.p1  ORF type:complete len:267 (+),score=108.07 NODE_14660_length_1095_cov_3.392562:212-1012(+)